MTANELRRLFERSRTELQGELVHNVDTLLLESDALEITKRAGLLRHERDVQYEGFKYRFRQSV